MIITYFFTFLCIKNDTIFQSNMCDYAENKKYKASPQDIINLGYSLTYINEHNSIAFIKGPMVLSANPDRTISHQRHTLTWETLRIVEDYQPFQISPVAKSPSIPKIIHQTDASDTPREQFWENIKQLKTLNKEYSYIYYNEKDVHDFIYTHFGWNTLKIFLRINHNYGAARADIFRYLCIYKMGGVYLDMKSGCERPFSEIIRKNDEILLSHWDSKKSTRYHGAGRDMFINYLPQGEYQQWFIISNSGNNLIEKAINQIFSNIELYSKDLHGTGTQTTLRVTGPHAFTRAIEPHVYCNNARMIDSEYEGINYTNTKFYKRINNYRRQTLPLVL